MKDCEQKYKEALERAKKELQACSFTDCDAYRQIIRLFPELKENEDERIQKELINLIYKVYANTDYITCAEHEEMLAWLEKQKPIEWSKADDVMLDDIILECTYIGDYPDYPNDKEREIYEDCEKQVKWLKSLKQRITKQY